MGNARIYVIGDIHGCVDELEALLDFIAPGRNDRICFLGDYVDRGPSSKAVVDRLVRLRHQGPDCTFLKGNHEDMFLAYLGLPGLYGDSFIMNGGGRTLASYGIDSLSGRAAWERIPKEHRDFFLSLEREVRFGKFLCVHAGIRPTQTLDQQTDEDRFWIREDFICAPHPFPFTILFGHTPRREVLLDLPYKVGLDTGLVYGNKLSCLDLTTKTLLQVRRATRTVTSRDLKENFARLAPLTSQGDFL